MIDNKGTFEKRWDRFNEFLMLFFGLYYFL
jgi:hypothetical protein